MLIAGCGDLGGAVARRLLAAGDTVWAVRRSAGALPAGVRPLIFDLTAAEYPPLPGGLDAVFYTAAPGAREESAYRAVYGDGLARLFEALDAAGEPPGRIFLASSTAVYGQSRGEWVDEGSATRPAGFAGRLLLEAEAALRRTGWPATAIRFGGIYGPGRTWLLRRLESGEPVQRTPPRYSNRIHRDDCAGLLVHLARHQAPEPLYVAVDDEPAPLYEVMAWIAARRALPPPPPLDRDPDSDAGKRCRNRRLHASGYRLLYPTFREGYGALLAGAAAEERGDG